MSIVLNLANRLYVLEEEFQGTVVYKISSDGNEVFCNEDESFQYRMNPEVYRLILEQLGAHTYYYQAGYQEIEVSFKEYEQTYLSFEEEDVFADSYFYELNQAIEAAQFLFEVFLMSGEKVECFFDHPQYDREMIWRNNKFFVQLDKDGRINDDIIVFIPTDNSDLRDDLRRRVPLVRGEFIQEGARGVYVSFDCLLTGILAIANELV